MDTQTHSGLVGCVVDIVATSNVRSRVRLWPALTCTVSVHKTCVVAIKKDRMGYDHFQLYLLSSGFSHHVGLLQEPGKYVAPGSALCIAGGEVQLSWFCWYLPSVLVWVIILFVHSGVTVMDVFLLIANINNTAQYIWCFLATVPRSANTWLVQSQIQAPCKPDTLLKVPTSLLWFVMLQIEHKTVDGQGFSVRFKWILKVFAHTGHYFTLLISLLTCKFKVRRNSPHLSSASGKLRTSVQLCPLWLFSEKNGHLQNSSHFSDYYPQREVCLTLFCWDVWLLDSLCWGRWMPSKLHIANRIVLNLSILMFGPKEEVGSPAQQHLQCHWKKVALAGVYVTFWRETFTKK